MSDISTPPPVQPEFPSSAPNATPPRNSGYAVASLVPVVVLGAVLARGYQEEALERGLDHGRAQAAVIEEMAIAPALKAVANQGKSK